MEILLLLLLVPVVWPFVARMIWNTTITWQEMLVQISVVSVLICACWFTGMYNATADKEYLNGSVTGKKMVEVSCEHSYDCNCFETCSGTGSSRSCSTTCSTCYDHNEDYDWRVNTSVGNFNVSRTDSQGKKQPKDWTKMLKGQPAAMTHDYTNYIKAVPESLIRPSWITGLIWH